MTCLETYATLRVFSKSIDPNEIGTVLGIDATDSASIDRDSRSRTKREWNRWEWCSRHSVQSIDNLQHIGAVADLLRGKNRQLEQLRSSGCDIDICCSWVSSGQGGPYLDTPTLNALAELELEVWWDVYFGKEDEYRDSDS